MSFAIDSDTGAETPLFHEQHQSLSLAELAYGMGRQNLVKAMTTIEADTATQCCRVCNATHQLYNTIRDLRTQDEAISTRIRTETLLASIHSLMAGFSFDLISASLAGIHFHRAAKGDVDTSVLLHELRYSGMLLHCCMDALDKIIEDEPETGIEICSDEGIPLRQRKDDTIEVNRLSLHWDYLLSRSNQQVTTEMLRYRTRNQADRLLEHVKIDTLQPL